MMAAHRVQAPWAWLAYMAEGPATTRLSDQIGVAGLICRITRRRSRT